MAGESEFRKARAAVVRGRTELLVDTNKEIVRLLKEADARIRAILAGQPTDYQQWALPRLQREIQQTLAQFGESAASEISTAAGKAWQLGQDLVDKPLDAGGFHVLRATIALQALDVRQLQAMRAFMTDRIKNIALEDANKINAELGLVVIGAQGPSDAIGATTKILGEVSRARARTIVRTELARAFAVASHERLSHAAKIVPGLQKQWRKSGKVHPRPHHDIIDGQIRDIDKPFTVKPFGKAAVELMFPLDPAAPASETINCGCVALPFKKSWKVEYPQRAPGGLEAAAPIAELLREARVYDPGQRRLPKGAKGGGRWTASGLAGLAEDARKNPARQHLHPMGTVSRGNVEAVAKLRLDLAGYRREVLDDDLRHAMKSHGSSRKELLRGQRALTSGDYARLPAIVDKPDWVARSPKGHRGEIVISYSKTIGAERYVYAESVSQAEARVRFVSLRVHAKRK